MDFFFARNVRAFLSFAAIAFFLGAPSAGFGATKYAAPDGRSTNSGDRASSPWDAKSCFSRLSPGDTCVYQSGNYGETRFEPQDNGTGNARITHRCEIRHGCWFDRLVLDGNEFLNIVNIASDSNYFDPNKSYTNPRMLVRNSHDLRFDSIYVRGEPQRCARGNPGPGCKDSVEHNRYNDLVYIGTGDSGSGSSRIEIKGASEFINGNHSAIVFFDDGDTQYCEETESNIWIHGTPETPIRITTRYHHNIEFKGACRVLVEYVDFGPAGTGRGDLFQPANSDSRQSGGIIHGSTMQNVIVRFSNLTQGGSATDSGKNIAHFEVGLFGRGGVNGACFPHNSHFRPWGPLAVVGLLNADTVKNVSIVNNAVSEGWYMTATDGRAATSPYAGFLLARRGDEGVFNLEVDGLAVDSASAENGLLLSRNGSRFSFRDSPFETDGVKVGSTVFNDVTGMFRNPVSGDYRPISGSDLVGSAVPIARTTASGSGTNIPVDRPECFAGTLGGMRSGDSVVIGGQRCTVVETSLSRSSISCSNPVSWNSGAEIYYRSSDGVMKDIGSRSVSSPFGGPFSDGKRPNPPELTSE